MDILIFSGQSNMQGQTECADDSPCVKNALEYRFLPDELIPLRNPVGEDIGELLLRSHLGNGSLVPSFVRTYLAMAGGTVVAVHAAKGATVAEEWLKGSERGAQRYAKTVEKVQAALKKCKDIKKKYFVWLQGESDALAGTSATDYKARLIRLKDDLKRDLGIDKFMMIEVGYFATWQGKRACDEEIQRAQESLCREDNDFLLLTDVTKKLSLDENYLNPQAEGHYTNAGMELIGTAAGSAAGAYRITDR